MANVLKTITSGPATAQIMETVNPPGNGSDDPAFWWMAVEAPPNEWGNEFNEESGCWFEQPDYAETHFLEYVERFYAKK